MATFKKLLATAWSTITDPNQQQRVEVLVDAIEHAFKQHREKFDLATSLQGLEYRASDLEAAKQDYYRRLLKRYWEKGAPDAKGQKILSFVAGKLALSPQIVLKLNQEIGLAYIGVKVGEFLQDGVLSDAEMQELTAVARYLRLDIHTLFRHRSKDEILGMLRNVFAEAAWSGRLAPKVWDNLRLSAAKLGFPESDLLASTSLLARSYAEHVLADVKSDGQLSANEEMYLEWLLRTFQFDVGFVSYVHGEIEYLKARGRILEGNLPTVQTPSGVNLKAGELLYFVGDCTFREARVRQGAVSHLDHQGRLLLTDHRLLFQSSTKSVALHYKSIIQHRPTSSFLQVSVSNKPEMTFFIPPNSDPLFAERVTAILGLHNQSLVRKVSGSVERHIPREVRQRVWQRYGGKCAECGATDYLEFDHIIPVSRGGGNADNNVQLLCRRCNLKKSDHI